PNPVYQGQFGTFTITDHDRREVQIYRTGLATAALCFALGTLLILSQGPSAPVLIGLDYLFALFCLALGVSLWTIHIYLRPLHQFLQGCWLLGSLSALGLALSQPHPLLLHIYQNPLTLLGVGFIFVALTGIFFKEAFCFNRLETKALTPLVPILLLGHLVGTLPPGLQAVLLSLWAGLFLVFSLRKLIQAIPDDIGDKSVFEYLKQQRQPGQQW
ncbi:MAG: DUF2301 domain-containing membrane protein, partial [Prochlorothrix sp.]